jgi:hypothetical protein
MRRLIPKEGREGEFVELYRASIDEVGPLCVTKLINTWVCRTKDALKEVLGKGYFDDVISHGLRRNDRIEVVANVGDLAEHATLAVDEIKDHHVVVSVLVAYTRQAPVRRAA